MEATNLSQATTKRNRSQMLREVAMMLNEDALARGHNVVPWSRATPQGKDFWLSAAERFLSNPSH